MPKVINANIKSVDYIITAKHYGGGNATGYIELQRMKIQKSRGIIIPIEYKPSKHAVQARIWQGQWVADCECGGCSFVDPDEPIFFCFGCGNRADNNRVREVVFPKDYKTIESLLLDRPVDDAMGLDDKERAGMAKPLIFVEGKGGLSRNWNPGETIDDIKKQNAPIESWRKEIARVK